ncbi:hypothetical protein CL616_01465 [archaeon]|nr:hypothetical protein [archaeon]
MDKFELVGAIYGDGHVHSTENRVTIVGSLEDFYYYSFSLKPYLESFGLNVSIKKRNDRNAYYLYFENKIFFERILSWGLTRGAKTDLVLPKFANNKEIASFLRGLFDTDGSLKFSKQSKWFNYYPRIQYSFKVSSFSDNLGKLFLKLGFNFSKWLDKRDNEYYYQISGFDNLKRWNKLIGFANPVHYSKYLFWEKFGQSIPKSSLDFRLKALNLKIEEFF